MAGQGSATGSGESQGATGARRGLFDGFEGYLTPKEEDYRRTLTSGLVVPDTNLLLNLYRYHDQTQADLFAVLEGLGDRLWVPHQVLVEFWRNRESALREPQRISVETVQALENLHQQLAQRLRTWTNQVAPPDEIFEEYDASLDIYFEQLIEIIASFGNPKRLEWTHDTARDSVLQRLGPLLIDRVGEPFEPEEHESQVREGLRRAKDGVPPGYRDGRKDRDGNLVEGSAGDYLVWAQVLREAQRRHRDVLFVTGDAKDDWWRKDHGQMRGPRLELFEELRAHAGFVSSCCGRRAYLCMLAKFSTLRLV